MGDRLYLFVNFVDVICHILKLMVFAFSVGRLDVNDETIIFIWQLLTSIKPKHFLYMHSYQ